MKHWGKQQFVPKVGIFSGKAFGTGLGVVQGNTKSSMVFNIMVDAGDIDVSEKVCIPYDVQHGLAWTA